MQDDEDRILKEYEILWDKSTPVKYLPGLKVNRFQQEVTANGNNRMSGSIDSDFVADIRINPSNLLDLPKFLENSDQKNSNLLQVLSSKSKKLSRFSELDSFLKSKKIDHLQSVIKPQLSEVLEKWNSGEKSRTSLHDSSFSVKWSNYCNYTKTELASSDSNGLIGRDSLLNISEADKISIEHLSKNTKNAGNTEMSEWRLLVGLHCANDRVLGGFLDPTSFSWSYGP